MPHETNEEYANRMRAKRGLRPLPEMWSIDLAVFCKWHKDKPEDMPQLARDECWATPDEAMAFDPATSVVLCELDFRDWKPLSKSDDGPDIYRVNGRRDQFPPSWRKHRR